MTDERLRVLRDQLALALEQGRSIHQSQYSPVVALTLDPRLPAELEALEALVHLLLDPPSEAEARALGGNITAWLYDHEDQDDRGILKALAARWEHKARMLSLLRSVSANAKGEGYQACATELLTTLGKDPVEEDLMEGEEDEGDE